VGEGEEEEEEERRGEEGEGAVRWEGRREGGKGREGGSGIMKTLRRLNDAARLNGVCFYPSRTRRVNGMRAYMSTAERREKDKR
jgi:hypothetical protein